MIDDDWKQRKQKEQEWAAKKYEQRKKALEPYVLCSCGEPLIIAMQKEETIICKCVRGQFCPDEAEFAYTADHPFFNHDQANLRVGGKITKPSEAWTVANAKGTLNTPLPPPQTSPPTPTPAQTALVKSYHCHTCQGEIDKAQAESSFNFTGKAQCKICIGKELIE